MARPGGSRGGEIMYRRRNSDVDGMRAPWRRGRRALTAASELRGAPDWGL
jgi:hypothetical protein